MIDLDEWDDERDQIDRLGMDNYTAKELVKELRAARRVVEAALTTPHGVTCPMCPTHISLNNHDLLETLTSYDEAVK